MAHAAPLPGAARAEALLQSPANELQDDLWRVHPRTRRKRRKRQRRRERLSPAWAVSSERKRRRAGLRSAGRRARSAVRQECDTEPAPLQQDRGGKRARSRAAVEECVIENRCGSFRLKEPDDPPQPQAQESQTDIPILLAVDQHLVFTERDPGIRSEQGDRGPEGHKPVLQQEACREDGAGSQSKQQRPVAGAQAAGEQQICQKKEKPAGWHGMCEDSEGEQDEREQPVQGTAEEDQGAGPETETQREIKV